ncbi:MAG: nitrous oxide reductase family maturation protein NosD, partial [Rhodospirillales bacterium]|nr:nitrous oxide reductase family maturation protein NosD [Rhodospirillales bacterium]
MRCRCHQVLFKAAGVISLAVGLVAFSGFFTGQAAAATLTLSPESGILSASIAEARPGDTLILSAGTYDGSVLIDKTLNIIGEDGAKVIGNGEGSVITVGAPDVTIHNLIVSGSGSALDTMDAGIFVNKEGDRALVEGNHIEDNLFGVYFWGPDDAIMRGNTVVGRTHAHVNARGNGISLWNTPGSIVENNDFSQGRDGIFSTTSKRNIFRNNRFQNVRIAVHYMYTDDSEVSGNYSQDNHVAYALMFSTNVTAKNNYSRNDRDHGILLNYTNASTFEGNVIENNEGKCVFIYNSNKNFFKKNRFTGCDIGVHFTAGSERNQITGNAFIANRTQVKYVGTRHLDWSHEGQGNYWSDNAAFDLDGDGIADTAYRPNDMVDQVMWAHPMAKILMNSPAIQVLRWAQSEFPSLHPGGVTDTAPLMAAPEY